MALVHAKIDVSRGQVVRMELRESWLSFSRSKRRNIPCIILEMYLKD